MSDPSDQIQALITQVDQALHQLNPPIPLLVWGEGVVQSRQVLQQVRDYLLASPQYQPTIALDPQENINPQPPEILAQNLSHLQIEVQALRQERDRMRAEIQRLQTQPLSAMTDYSLPSTSIDFPEILADFADSSPQTATESLQNINPPVIGPQDSSAVDEDLSDIFGELQFDQTSSFDRVSFQPNTEPARERILDTAIHLDSPEPPLDGQEYILASPHENLLPVDQDEDQVDSLLLVGRGTLQRLETELMSLEETLDEADEPIEQEAETLSNTDQSVNAVPRLAELYAQLQQNLAQFKSDSDSSPQTLGELLEQSNPTALPLPRDPEVESSSLEALSQEFSQSSPKKQSQKPDPSQH